MKEFKIENLSHTTGNKPLFNEIDFSIMNEEKVGLIGQNGTGKSSFLKIMSGILEPDKGNIQKPGDYQIGYLSQEPDLDEELNVLQTVFAGNSPIMKTVRQYEQILIDLERDPSNEKLQKKFTEIQVKMDMNNAWNADAEAKRILSILGISMLNQKINKLSGGQQKRVALAQVLIQTPDLLILDEPTNHLDFQMINWLENYLVSYKGALLLVTHDRYFLDRVVDKIVELKNGTLEEYPGNYQKYVELKAEREAERAAQDYKNRQLYKQELAWMREGVQARGTKQKARIERFENLKKNISNNQSSFKLEMDLQTTRLGKQVYKLDDATYHMHEKAILDHFNYIVQRHDRIGITGVNGTGKSTFLNILTEKIPLDAGELFIGETVRVAYFQQSNIELPGDKRVINYLQEVANEVQKRDGHSINISQLLEQFMFPREQHGSTIRSLSGGEKRRLYLVKLLMERPNVLLLDEPTNNLDIDTLNVLEEYIEEFPGAVIVVSHDRYFLDKITDKLLVFEGNGHIREFYGTADEYFKKFKQENQETKQEKQTKKATARDKTKSTKKEKTKLSYMEEKEWATIEDEIMELEERIEELDAQMLEAGSDYDEIDSLYREKSALEEGLNEKYERWEYLSKYVN